MLSGLARQRRSRPPRQASSYAIVLRRQNGHAREGPLTNREFTRMLAKRFHSHCFAGARFGVVQLAFFPARPIFIAYQ